MNPEKIGNIELLILRVEQNYTKQSRSETREEYIAIISCLKKQEYNGVFIPRIVCLAIFEQDLVVILDRYIKFGEKIKICNYSKKFEKKYTWYLMVPFRQLFSTTLGNIRICKNSQL